MTKSAELVVLDRAIAALGQNSYLGPWLTEHRADIVADITNDVCIDVPMPSVARREAQRLIDEANRRRDEILVDARARADAMLEEARQDREKVRARAAARLSELAAEVRKDWRL